MKYSEAKYFRRGFSMSRRAYISHKNHEHPVSHWIKILSLDKETIEKMLICIGIHHTGMYAMRTKFYRFPKLNNEKEMNRFSKTFRTIPTTKKKFFRYVEDYFGTASTVTKTESMVKNNSGKPRYISLRDIEI